MTTAISNTVKFSSTTPVSGSWSPTTIPLMQWTVVPTANRLSDLAPSGVLAGTGVQSVVNAWSGGCLRPSGSHYIIHGGGHGDYAGNEVYTISLADSNPTWIRRWGPSLTQQGGQNYYNDGNPASIHTMFTLVYDPDRDQMMRMAGGQYITDGYNGNIDAWLWGTQNLDPTDRTIGKAHWAPAGTYPNRNVSDSGYDGHARNSITRDIYTWAQSRLSIYRDATKATELITQWENRQSRLAGMCFDPYTNLSGGNKGSIWAFSNPALQNGAAWNWDCNDNARRDVALGAGSVAGGVSNLAEDNMPVYDLANRCVWIMSTGTNPNQAGSVLETYRFDTTTHVLSAAALTNGTKPTLGSGGISGNPCGRFQYVPELKGLVMQPNYTSSLYYMRVQ